MENKKATQNGHQLDTDYTNKLQSLIETSVETAVNRALEKRDAKIAALELELSATRSELRSTQERLIAAERSVESMEAESRKNCIVITGVPELPDENTDNIMLDVAQAAGAAKTASDIDRSHRLGRNRGTIDRQRAILLKLQANKKRQELFNSRKELSAHRVRDHPILTPQVLEDVYLIDFLTQRSQHLLFICRQLKKRKQIWAGYSTNGKIKIRVREDQPSHIVNDQAELQSLVGPDNHHLRETIQASNETSPLSHGQTAAEATGNRGTNASRQAPNRANGDSLPGPATFKARKQPARQTGRPQ